MIQTTCYQNQDFSLIWKPQGVPSTFGKEKSFLDYMQESENNFMYAPLSKLLPEELVSLAIPRLSEYVENNDIQAILHVQVDTFGQEQEFGLLNRLDNDTGGFLYFARNQKAYDVYKELQKEEKITKYYLAQVSGQLKTEPRSTTGQHLKLKIDFPIMHRTAEKMIAIQNPRDSLKGRGKEHHVVTNVELLHYDKTKDISTLLITIPKGIRHQIRVHLASTGTPIIGDSLYGGKSGTLHLRSIGFILDRQKNQGNEVFLDARVIVAAQTSPKGNKELLGQQPYILQSKTENIFEGGCIPTT